MRHHLFSKHGYQNECQIFIAQSCTFLEYVTFLSMLEMPPYNDTYLSSARQEKRRRRRKKRLITQVHNCRSHGSITWLSCPLTGSFYDWLTHWWARVFPITPQKSSGMMAEGLVQHEVHQRVGWTSQSSQKKQTALHLDEKEDTLYHMLYVVNVDTIFFFSLVK